MSALRAGMATMAAGGVLLAFDLLMTHHGGGLPPGAAPGDRTAFFAVWWVAGGLATWALTHGLAPLGDRLARMEGTTRPVLVGLLAGVLAGAVHHGVPDAATGLGLVVHGLAAGGLAWTAARRMGSAWGWLAGLGYALCPGALAAVGSPDGLALAAVVGALAASPAVAVVGTSAAVVGLAAVASGPWIPLHPWVALGTAGSTATGLAVALGWPVGFLLAALVRDETWARALLAGALAALVCPGGSVALLPAVVLASASGAERLAQGADVGRRGFLALVLVTAVGYLRHVAT